MLIKMFAFRVERDLFVEAQTGQTAGQVDVSFSSNQSVVIINIDCIFHISQTLRCLDPCDRCLGLYSDTLIFIALTAQTLQIVRMRGTKVSILMNKQHIQSGFGVPETILLLTHRNKYIRCRVSSYLSLFSFHGSLKGVFKGIKTNR